MDDTRGGAAPGVCQVNVFGVFNAVYPLLLLALDEADCQETGCLIQHMP